MTERPDFHLHHGCISVADIDLSVEFYTRVLGFEQESSLYVEGISTKIVFLRRGNDRLELVSHDDAKPLPEFAQSVPTDFQVIDTKHLSFHTDAPEKLHSFFSEQGVDGLTEVFDNNPNYTYFFFRDPDGIAIEIVSKKSDTHG